MRIVCSGYVSLSSINVRLPYRVPPDRSTCIRTHTHTLVKSCPVWYPAHRLLYQLRFHFQHVAASTHQIVHQLPTNVIPVLVASVTLREGSTVSDLAKRASPSASALWICTSMSNYHHHHHHRNSQESK